MPVIFQTTICGLISQNRVISTFLDLPPQVVPQYHPCSIRSIHSEYTFSHFWMIFCVVPMTSQWNILTSTQFQGVYNGSSNFPSFFNTFLFIGTSLLLYSSINLVSNIWIFLCVPVGVFWCFLNVFTAVGHVRYGVL